jgi:5-methylcytosine-specific restriction endonuclease McrA
MTHMILKLDVSGQPVRWISWQQAVVLYVRERIAWTAGNTQFSFRGGINQITRQQSILTIHSIIATKGRIQQASHVPQVPPLTNLSLFRRDGYMCMYCGASLPVCLLTRDHILPLSRGGHDCWSNVISACQPCNTRKGCRTPEEANLQLIAIPFVPSRSEFLVLSNRKILADQMDFLKSRFLKDSKLRYY